MRKLFNGWVTLEGIRWDAVLLGWAAALVGGIVISLVLRALYKLATGFPVERGEVTLSVVTVSLISGFTTHLICGCVVGRRTRRFGGLNGAMTAVFGLLLGLMLAIVLTALGTVFPEGVAVPHACFGLAGEALPAGTALFSFNLFGGYLGGKLGEPYQG